MQPSASPIAVAVCQFHDAGPQLVLPNRMAVRRQIVHREAAGRPVLAQDSGHGRWDDLAGDPHPLNLGAVALDRDAPIGRDP
jgi:hypothetical protein